jgi:hypothetical protein
MAQKGGEMRGGGVRSLERGLAHVDEGLMPDWPFLDDPKWDAHLYYYHVKASYLLVIDNLLDLSHVSFTHADTVGDPKFADTPPAWRLKVKPFGTFSELQRIRIPPRSFVALPE